MRRRCHNTDRTNSRISLAPVVACALLSLTASSAQAAIADDAIVAVRDKGRIVFVNNDAPAPNKPADVADSTGTARRLVYWSNTEHRWKQVPKPTKAALRNA